MKDSLTYFNKVCEHCKESKHISKFITNKRRCHYCYECRQLLYVRCIVCGLRKKKGEMDRIEDENIVCKKCTLDRSEMMNTQFNEAFKIMDSVKSYDAH